MRTLLVWSGCGLLLFFAGFLAGRATSPLAALGQPGVLAPSITRAITDPEGSNLNGDPGDSIGIGQQLAEQWMEAADAAPAQDLVRTFSDWGGDPQGVVENVIDSMSDEQLGSLLSSLTSLDQDELDDVYDIRRYANRMAELALGDLTGEAPLRDSGLQEVYFSDSPDAARAIEEAATEFENPKRLHAILPMENYQGDRVFVKWTRVDDQEVMLFDQYPIRAESDYNWVYLEPRSGWPSGEYSVDFYSSDEEMMPVGGGNYRIK